MKKNAVGLEATGAANRLIIETCLVAKTKIPIFFRYLHEDLNLDKIKNTLHSLHVNRETNLMNLIRP